MNLKLKMKAEVSLVDRTDWLGAMTAVKTGKPCHHREISWRAPYEIQIQLLPRQGQ